MGLGELYQADTDRAIAAMIAAPQEPPAPPSKWNAWSAPLRAVPAAAADALAAGAEIYEYRGAQTLHSKVSWFDGLAATLGAYNVNSRSHSCDAEDVLSLEDRRAAAAIRQMLDRDLSRAVPVTMATVQTWKRDTLEQAKERFFKVFSPLF